MNPNDGCQAPDTDIEQMNVVANCRGVSEYRVFEDAFRAWGRDASEQSDLERGFAHYLRAGEAPVWVRHYVRSYLKEHQSELVAHAKDLALGRMVERISLALIVLMVILALAW
jgi:hypothetical protein